MSGTDMIGLNHMPFVGMCIHHWSSYQTTHGLIHITTVNSKGEYLTCMRDSLVILQVALAVDAALGRGPSLHYGVDQNITSESCYHGPRDRKSFCYSALCWMPSMQNQPEKSALNILGTHRACGQRNLRLSAFRIGKPAEQSRTSINTFPRAKSTLPCPMKAYRPHQNCNI